MFKQRYRALITKTFIMIKLQNIIFALFLINFLGFTGLSAQNSASLTHETVDLSSSHIGWKAYKVGGAHEGHLKLKSADLQFEGQELIGGSFIIDMTSITVTDLEGEWADKLTGHLKSPDFFAVEDHPTASFKIKNVYSRGAPGDYKIVGDLSIKGFTKEIKFNALFDNGVGTANLSLDRTDFEIKYGSSTFLGNLGDKTIYDDFDLELKLVTK